MAGHTTPGDKLVIPPSPHDPRELAKADTSDLEHPKATRDLIREAAAKLYGQGFPRARVARVLLDHLVPNGKHRPEEQRLQQARTKLRRWEATQSFRDLVYEKAVVELDMSTPQILKGIARKAKRGNVQAARLSLEVTNRHNPKGDQAPTQVAVVFQGVPRPEVDLRAMPPTVDAEVEDV